MSKGKKAAIIPNAETATKLSVMFARKTGSFIKIILTVLILIIKMNKEFPQEINFKNIKELKLKLKREVNFWEKKSLTIFNNTCK